MKNIYEKLNEVRKAVPYVQKDAEVQGYTGVTHDQVTANVREHLIKAGVLVLPNQLTANSVDVGKTVKGATVIRYEAWYSIAFVNMDDPKDKVEITVQAHANDQGDKAPGKAMSYATKYAFLKILSIETGENEEGRLDVAMRQHAMSAEQYEHLHQLMEATDTNPEAFRDYLNNQLGTSAQSLAELDEGSYRWATQALEAKRRRLEKEAQSAEKGAESDDQDNSQGEGTDGGEDA